MKKRSTLLWIAGALLILWVILRVALAVTGLLLHLLWVLAIVFVAMWLFTKAAR